VNPLARICLQSADRAYHCEQLADTDELRDYWRLSCRAWIALFWKAVET